ncbi:unnamed protein product [Chrysoparadoxa australica]
MTFTIKIPPDFVLSSSVRSYGFFRLAPTVWDDEKGLLQRPLRYGNGLGGVAPVFVSQTSGVLQVEVGKELKDDHHLKQLNDQIVRMLRQVDFDLTSWYQLCPEASEKGFGRLFRSPTLFEDMVKTICCCNIGWKQTMSICKKLCDEYGTDGAFPLPEDIAGEEEEALKSKAGVGYRADRLIRLAKKFVDGSIRSDWMEDKETGKEELYDHIIGLHGFGPFASANCLQLLGHFESFPFDSETRRIFK